MPRKSNYRSRKGGYYRSYKKRRSKDDINFEDICIIVSYFSLFIISVGILGILGVIVQIIITYYYVFIILALIGLIIYFEFYANKKSGSSQFKYPAENRGTPSGEYNDPKISSHEMNSPSKDNLSSGNCEDKSFRRPENLKNCEFSSNGSHDSYFESDIQSEYVEKGNKFEKYIVDKFDDRFFSIVEWTTDMGRKHNRFVESDCNPDLVIRDRKTNEIFCVECKYRSNIINEYFNWSYPEQMDRYFSYAHERKIPFYVVLGSGGSPDSPADVFCVPLVEAEGPKIHISKLRKYHHNPTEALIWKNGILR